MRRGDEGVKEEDQRYHFTKWCRGEERKGEERRVTVGRSQG